MIIKSISAENFGKFDRYSVNLDENINVFYGDNEAGKTTLYEIISILLFAPTTDEEIVESNKLIKTDEKYARVYATINMDGKVISIAREIYFNDTNLSIAEQENVSSLGNVNVPFIGDLTKEMYEAFHTIDYYNMATITNNVWKNIIKVIEESHGAPRITPDFSSPEEEVIEKQNSPYEVQVKDKENEKKQLEAKLKQAQRKQKMMIKNQDKIDNLLSDYEDVDNNIELESSYLKEAIKMNQIRENIKKTQDLTLELEKYKSLNQWMPNLREHYDRLKLYTENKENGIENPLDMFDDLEVEVEAAANEPEEEKNEGISGIKAMNKSNDNLAIEAGDAKEVKAKNKEKTHHKYTAVKLPSEDEYNLAKDKISKFIKARSEKNEISEAEILEEMPISKEEPKEDKINEKKLKEEPKKDKTNEKKPKEEPKEKKTSEKKPKEEKSDKSIATDLNYLNNKMNKMKIFNKDLNEEHEAIIEVKPLEIKKPKTSIPLKEEDEAKETRNGYGQTNPYSDNIFPDTDNVNYSNKIISYEETDDKADDDKYSLSASNDIPTQTKKVSKEDLSGKVEEEDEMLKIEGILNSIDMQEIIAASKEVIEVDDETKEEIKRAKLRYNIIAKRIFNEDVDMDEISNKLSKLDTNAIYKTIVKYKGLSQKLRKTEQGFNNEEKKPSSIGGSAIALGIVAVLSMLLGLACFFIDQIVILLPDINALDIIYQVIMDLPLNNIVAGNILSGGAFILISILLTVAIILGNDKGGEPLDLIVGDDIELDELKNKIRKAKREVIDALKDFPIPSSYLENPNNSIITRINELHEAETTYSDLAKESTISKNENYRALWKLTRKHLSGEEFKEDLFDNIALLRRKIKDYKEEKEEQERKLKEAKMLINLVNHPNQKDDESTDAQFGAFNNFNGFKKTNQNIETQIENKPDGLSPNNVEYPEQRDIRTQSADNASENNAYRLPETNKSVIENTNEPEKNIAENKLRGMHPSQSSGLMQKEEVIYPSEGGVKGTNKDLSYPTDGGLLSAVKGTDYSPESPKPLIEDTSVDSNNGDFGIAGIRRYTNDAAALQKPTENKGYIGSGGEQQTANSAKNPYDISDIKRYTENETMQQMDEKKTFSYDVPEVKRHLENTSPQNTEEDKGNNFGIPGIKRYTNDSHENALNSPFEEKNTEVIPEALKQKTPENPYGISGIKKYIHEAPVQKEEGLSAKGSLSGLPGVEKFSNRHDEDKEGFVKNKEDISSVVVPIVTSADVSLGVTAGAAALSGLPGIDKFSNRTEQDYQKQVTKTPTIEEDINKKTIEEDPFGIPGIKRYIGTESVDSVGESLDEVKEEEPVENIEEANTETEAKEALENINSIEKTDVKQDEPQEEIEFEEEIEPEKLKIKDRRETEYDELLELLGDDPESTIRTAEEVSRELQRETIKRDNAMASLLKLNDAAVRLSTLSSNKWPYKQKAIDASRERIDYLEADKLKLRRHLEMLEKKIEEVDYEDTPQAIADKTKVIEEEIEQLKLENDKHAIVKELMEKQKILDISSSADRSHIINDTSVYMKELTLGKYIQVKINDDLSGLSICDKDGQWFDTTKDRLSQATREQLYLALRISIADLFDEKSLIFPMFFDEALITWDKRRMKAVMRLLSKMSMHRQVIIFTCHDWLKDMIGDYLIGAKIIEM